MADYAGAVAAIVARFKAQYSAITLWQFQNEDPPQPIWPPEPAAPWVYFQVLQTESATRGVGMPGSKTWLTSGQILIEVFVPQGYGFAEHVALAEPAGEVFRAQTFYVGDPGAKVECFAPAITGGDSADDNGMYFVLQVSIPFHFYFIK